MTCAKFCMSSCSHSGVVLQERNQSCQQRLSAPAWLCAGIVVQHQPGVWDNPTVKFPLALGRSVKFLVFSRVVLRTGGLNDSIRPPS